jgi:RNA polymerase sigma-70 factor (ECF subfamily)
LDGPATSANLGRQVGDLYRAEGRRIFASLIRLLGDFDLAEEALQEAFQAALERWPTEGVPAQPRSWLVSTGRFKAIDRLRRRARFQSTPELEAVAGAAPPPGPDDAIADDRLRLIFTCCHPALSIEAQLALTLREVCGLTTEEIARAFLLPAPTLAQRIVRAKTKIRDARIPYQVPEGPDLPLRLGAVLRTLYLVFNAGYSAAVGDAAEGNMLTDEAIRLGRILVELLPVPEATGLLALMLLHDARRATRVSAAGELVLLEDQDRSRWNRRQIEEAARMVQGAFRAGRPGAYLIQAAIAALHAEAPSAAETDWREIAALYDILALLERSPVVELNRAVAWAMLEGPAAGLDRIDALLGPAALADYGPAHIARAELLSRLGRNQAAAEAYARALPLTRVGPERRFIESRLRRLA